MMQYGDWLATHWLAVGLLVLYGLFLLINGWVGRRQSQSMSDYYVGGRNLGGLAVGVSFFATFASTNSYIGHAGKGYEFGAPWMLMTLIMIGFTYLSWTTVAPRLRQFASYWDALTLPDYLSARFPSGDNGNGNALSVAAGLVILFCSMLYLIAIFKGAGNLFQIFFGVSYASAIAITLIIVVLYTSLGGFVSVVRTDVLQGLMMLLGALCIFYFVTRAAGGVFVLGELAAAPDTAWLFGWNAGIPLVVLLGIALSGSLKLLVDPRQVSRFYALKDDRSVRVGVWVAVSGVAIIQLCLFPIGIYAHALLSGVRDTDMIVPTLVADPTIFPIWVSDFLLVAIVAAAMSSMDSVLLVAASVLYKDLFVRMLPKTDARTEGQSVTWTRLCVVVLAVVAAGFALNPPGGIVEITIFSGSLYAVCFFPAIVFGLHWLPGNATAVLASMMVGVVVLVLWMSFGPSGVVHEVFPALAASIVAYLLVARLRPQAIQQWPDTPVTENPGEY